MKRCFCLIAAMLAAAATPALASEASPSTPPALAAAQRSADHQAMTEQVAAFIANPAGWPAAMAARALRLRSGHPAYSPNNHALIVCQLWGRFAAEGLSDEAAFDAAIRAAAEEIAPRYVWSKRGYAPTGGALAVWSRPVPMWIDPATGKKATKDTPGAEERRVFRIEQTYRAQLATCNPQHLVASGWIAIPDDVSMTEQQAAAVFEACGAWDQNPVK